MARRKRYSEEFKRQALRRADEPGVTDACYGFVSSPSLIRSRAAASDCGFNRSMQHTNLLAKRGRVADEVQDEDLLHRS